MILQKDHLTEAACQVYPQERPRLVGYPGEMDATLNCTFSFIRQQYRLLQKHLFLPASSPDCSPIEAAFSKIKAFLRRRKARTRETLEEAIAQALLTVTSQDTHGWFEHEGYLVTEERKS